MANQYAPLWVKSNYSFLQGASHPTELVEQAHALGLPAIALTDCDGVYGVVQAHMKAKELGIQLLIGAEVTVNSPTQSPTPVILLAESRAGYANLCRLISRGRLQNEKGSACVSERETMELASGLIALTSHSEHLAGFKEAFEDRLYAMAARHLREKEVADEARLREKAKSLSVPIVGASEVLYHHQSRQSLHDVLSCIRHGVSLRSAGTKIRANAEHDLKTDFAMDRLFADDPTALHSTLDIASRCSFSLSELRYRYPIERLPDGRTALEHLRELTLQGAKKRYPKKLPSDVRAQIERELQLISDLDYGGYFLTMHEIVNFCQHKNILCQGRGSAANSAVCFCLGITVVDPARMDLLFERFLSKERAEPPDIDLDIEHERREEVIQWVYQRYGRDHAAMVCNVIRYRTKSAVREVGKALGLPETALNRLSKLLGSRFSELHHDALTQSGLDPTKARHQHLLSLIDEIRDFPRHLSIHPGGFLLGSERIDSLVPIENATMNDRTVIQWDKYSIEDLELFKVDLLGLGALTQSRKCLELLREHKGIDMTLADIPEDDAETFEMISQGDTVGVFQIESRAQMSMLPRLKPSSYYDLVVQIAIVRPGPIQGDMVHPYLRRRDGSEEEDYPHPLLREALGRTLGIPIFQEQVMKIAMLVGDYTGGEADQLRKDMGAWKSSGRMERHHKKLTQNMVKNGITPEYAERIFSQIRGFGEYGFPESHAASFAVIAYATSWMRCHHPAFFACSLLNSLPMGFYSPSTIVEDIKRKGVEVRPIDIQQSHWDCTLEKKGDHFALRMGFRFIKGLSTYDRDALESCPAEHRTELESFVRHTGLPDRSLAQLARSGAFECLGIGRRDAIWNAKKMATRRVDTLRLHQHDPRQGDLFVRLNEHEKVAWDHQNALHSTRGHPMHQLRDELYADSIPTATELNALPSGKRARYVGLVICRQQPGTATGVTFYTLEDETGFVNLVVWRPVFERHSIIARTASLLGVTGKVQTESGVTHLIATRLWIPNVRSAPRELGSRNFH